eukprot:TRINITY_DN14494_c0_g1_i1.p1 TRINITY_DN14494_c0_g1~~TRINITY_DN14494_c0_g1_i1.p1  ORF type:complete len:533 (-),score=122.09 TRINITY_DN14494_c0_g1_i1:24-1622(-)
MEVKTVHQKIQEVDERWGKPWQSWLMYLTLAFGPAVLGLMTIANVIAAQPRSVERLTLAYNEVKMPDIITPSIPIFLVCIFVEILINHFQKKDYYRLNDALSSLFAGGAQQIFGIVSKAFTVFPYLYIYATYGKLFQLYTNHFFDDHWLISGIILFIGVDHSYYWFHRMSHEWNTFWAAHIVHHSSEEFNFTTALRQSLVQPMFGWVFYLPFAFIYPVEFYFYFYQINTLYQFWIHTRVVDKLPAPIEFIFNTPSHHRVHHGRNPIYIDKNYAGVFIIWDRIYGTFQEETEAPVYGVTVELNTWSPLYTQFHHWIEIWDTQKFVPSFAGKLRLIIDRGPGYNYDVLNTNNSYFSCNDLKRLKYDAKVSGVVNTIYLIAQTVLIAGGVFGFGMFGEDYGYGYLFVWALWLLSGMYGVLAAVDRRRYWKELESVRMMALGFMTLEFMDFEVIENWKICSAVFAWIMASWIMIWRFGEKGIEVVVVEKKEKEERKSVGVVDNVARESFGSSSGGSGVVITPKGQFFEVVEEKKVK